MKSRYMLSALAFMVVMVMTTNAFAQGEFRVTSGTEARGAGTMATPKRPGASPCG